MTVPHPRSSRDENFVRPRLSTRDLLVCAVFGGITALASIALASTLATVATISPPLYALLGGYSAIGPMLALRLIGRTGAATITAVCAGVIAWPFSALGFLLLLAFAAPAMTMDAVYMLRARIGERAAMWTAAAAAAVVIFVVSLPVISPEQLTPLVVTLALLGRLISYAVACGMSAAIVRALKRAGVGNFARTSRRAPRESR